MTATQCSITDHPRYTVHLPAVETIRRISSRPQKEFPQADRAQVIYAKCSTLVPNPIYMSKLVRQSSSQLF